MGSLTALYQTHLDTLQGRASEILARCALDAMLIHSGELLTVFFDDHHYPFKVNPHFKAWVPLVSVANCWLWIDGVNKPKLWFYSPVDYWHKVEPLPNSFWTDEVEIIPFPDVHDIQRLLPASRDNLAYIGPSVSFAGELGLSAVNINPAIMRDYLNYHRGYKTEYELHCMREAQKIAVKGHNAAKSAFFSGMSEFDINSVYLSATQQRDDTVPYSNIIALNEHAAILHYTQLDKQVPEAMRSFLIDAGAEYHGYAADLTRSYAQADNSDYASLITDLNSHTLALIATMRIGLPYGDLHQQMHQRLAKLLIQHRIIEGISEEAIVEQGLTGPFMPHGLGHLLGLQVHDVAGLMQSDRGDSLPPPTQYPWLRCTRTLAPGMVVTIEPGIYFIESLLSPWREGPFTRYFNWSRIEAMKPYGGIRIEDNIVIHAEGVENMTRDLSLS